MPRVENAFLYSDMGSFPVGGREWEQWLASNTAFYFASPRGTFTARREERSGGGWYWYAYRKRQRGKVQKQFKAYLGRSFELTSSRLAEIAEQLDQRIQASFSVSGKTS